MGPQTKMFSSYPGYYEVQSALAEFFQSPNKVRIWWYNIIWDNNRIISHILRLDPITAGYVLLTDYLVSMKRQNYEPISTVKRT